MAGQKRNCWEFKRCGREAGGAHEKELGRCPAAMHSKLDTVHGGVNAGRACWIVAGTMCNGTVQGSFAQKHLSCSACEFHKLVEKEEGAGFVLSTVLLKMLKFR